MTASPLKAVVVSGPTASGKSAFGIALARELRGEIVNVDSVQVYRGLDIGSAKVSSEERAMVPHRLLDIREPNEPMNAGEFRDLALKAVSEISARGHLPVLVGGTTMYLTVLLHGIVSLPETPKEVRKAVAALSPEEQFLELSRVDPATAARLHSNDSQRVSRALEIWRISGRPPSELHSEHSFSSRDLVGLVIVLCRDRDDLYERINRRAEEMVHQGILEEARVVRERFGEVSALETVGYKQALQVLKGELAHERLAGEIALYTRRFAKRQMTYLRNEPAKRGWLVVPCEGDGMPTREVGGGEGGSKVFKALVATESELIKRVRERLAQPLELTEVWYVSLS
jgi:tRNA dimethylallyltransferase